LIASGPVPSGACRVPEIVCGGCHAQIHKEHVLDAGHSYGPGPGNLGINWERNIGVPHYKSWRCSGPSISSGARGA